MKNAILLHGLPSQNEYYDPERPSSSNAHWFPWLQKQLLIKEIKTDTPEVFRPFELDWLSWKVEVERFTIGPDTTLVGHSTGGGFWVRYLSEHPEVRIDKLILVAPWLNPNQKVESDFFKFDIDPTIVNRVNTFVIFSSDDDKQDVQDSVRLLTNKFPKAVVKSFHGYGHFTSRVLKDGTFPELLEVCL